MPEPVRRAPFYTYFQARGYMQRKAFATVVLSLFFFSILLQIGIAKQLLSQGVDVQKIGYIPLPVWAHVVMMLASFLVIPAIIMRARDAAWPILPFAGLFGVHILLGILYNFAGITIPQALGVTVQGATYLSLLALIFRRTN